MMHKTVKLRENYLFQRMYRKGTSRVSSCIAVYYRKNKNRKYNRLGITATKKIGGAVERNRARRVITEAYRLLEPSIPAGLDIVIVARKAATRVKMQTVKKQLQDMLAGLS